MKCSIKNCNNDAVHAVSVHNAPNYAVCREHKHGVPETQLRYLNQPTKTSHLMRGIEVCCRTCGKIIDPDDAYEVFKPWREILCGDCA